VPIPETKYKRSKNVFSVTSIALSCGHIWARLLKPLAQSLIGSPGNLLSSNHVRQGWDLFETNVRIQWNPVYKAFHRIRFCETNQFVSSDSKVILTRQTCGQRLGMAAGGKRRALVSYFLPSAAKEKRVGCGWWSRRCRRGLRCPSTLKATRSAGVEATVVG